MLSQICKELNNYFDRGMPHFHGVTTIENGKITDADFLEAIEPNQYFCIKGSVFNDGVHKNDDSLKLTDEIFIGEVRLMAIPKDVIELSDKVKAWMEKYSDMVDSPYTSESFGEYSYSKASGSKDSSNPTWQSVFKNELLRWKKICLY